MDIIEIFFYLGSFAIGAIGVWFLNYKKLIKGFNIKEKNAENLILNAKQKANKLLKDTEKKVKSFKDTHTKKIKAELNKLEKELDDKKASMLDKEKEFETQSIELTRKEAQLEMREKSCEDIEASYLNKFLQSIEPLEFISS